MKWKSTVLFRVTQDSLVLVEARVPPAPLASTRPRLEVRRVPTAGLASTRQAQAQLLVTCVPTVGLASTRRVAPLPPVRTAWRASTRLQPEQAPLLPVRTALQAAMQERQAVRAAALNALPASTRELELQCATTACRASTRLRQERAPVKTALQAAMQQRQAA